MDSLSQIQKESVITNSPNLNELLHSEEVTHFSRQNVSNNPFEDTDSGLRSSSSHESNGENYDGFSSDDDESDVEYINKNFTSPKRPKAFPISVSNQNDDNAKPCGSKDTNTIYYFERDFSPEPENVPGKSESPKTGNKQPSPSNTSSRTHTLNSQYSSDSFNLAPINYIEVRFEDVVYSALVFLSHLISLVADIALVCIYYMEDMKWASGLTFFWLLIGSVGILQQFGATDKDRLDRLFTRGRRVRLITSCFPPIGPIISSYYSIKSAWKAGKEQRYSVQFFATEEFAQSLSRTQGFFQCAPQAALQLIVLMETLTSTTPSHITFTLLSITSALSIMTTSNLPGRNDMLESIVRKGVYTTVSRTFLGIRMISSFGSRTMSIAYFFMGLKCILGTTNTFPSILFAVTAILVPRITFTFIDFCYHFYRVRKGRESNQTTKGRLSFCGTLTGYLATIFFPMSDPIWIFWFIWIETSIFIVWGNVSTWLISPPCLSTWTNIIYTLIFLFIFIIIPICLPYARATIKNQKLKRMNKRIQQQQSVENRDYINSNVSEIIL